MENKFDEVVEKLRFLDGVTKKSAKRMAIDLVNKNNKIENAQEALDIIKNDLGQCPTCFYMTIDNVCPICSDPDRDKNLIAVVSTMSDAMTIEEIHDYNGAYAVLNGEINLSKNITPDKLTIDKLFNRTNKNTELILALNSTFNGELTANYIRDIARQRGIKYTRLARGIPVGGVLDYVDEKTLSDALKNRKKRRLGGNSMFITLEGPDGSGKTTVVEPLKKHLEDEGYKVLVTREPGGTKISEEIRNVLLKKRDEKMDPWTEALLFIASRKQHLVDVIIPALKDGYIVICDRYMDSTSAYQGAGRGLKVNDIDEVQHIVLGEWVPNLTLYFNVDIDVANARMNTRDESKNRLDEENNDYKKKVISGYKDLIKKHPERFEVVDANKDKDNVLKQAIRIVDEKLKNEKK